MNYYIVHFWIKKYWEPEQECRMTQVMANNEEDAEIYVQDHYATDGVSVEIIRVLPLDIL